MRWSQARLATTIAVGLFVAAACASVADPTQDVTSTASSSSSPLASPSPDAATWASPPVHAFEPPLPICPSPDGAVTLPDVTVWVGGAPGVIATRWSSTTMTCTTTGTDDSPGLPSSKVVSTRAGDQLALVLPTGWAFLRVEVVDWATTGDATARPPIDRPDHPAQVNVLGPARSGDSIVGFDLWIIRDDGRVVGRLGAGVRVRVE